MPNYSVVFRQPVFNDFLNSPKGEVGEKLDKWAKLMLFQAKRQVGVRTGALRASIHMTHERMINGQEFRIGSDLNYALVHHQGSRPHLITPDRAEMLRFTSRGRVVYSHQVMHPGTKANRYLSDQLAVVRVM
jgi:hypothetical protein